MKKRFGRYPAGSRRGSLHHCQDPPGCERQFIQLDSGIHQALRAKAGLECSEAKWISRRFEYFMSEICGGQVEAPGSEVVFVLFLISFLFRNNFRFTNHVLCVFETQQIYAETQKKKMASKEN